MDSQLAEPLEQAGTGSKRQAYTAPTVEVIGSVLELTAGGGTPNADKTPTVVSTQAG